jgi:hypothetical protein
MIAEKQLDSPFFAETEARPWRPCSGFSSGKGRRHKDRAVAPALKVDRVQHSPASFELLQLGSPGWTSLPTGNIQLTVSQCNDPVVVW